MQQHISISRSNPFATRFVAPGKLAWIARTDAEQIGRLVNQLSSLNQRAAIVGPHGSGKSTLLEHLVPELGQVVFRRSATGSIEEHEPKNTETLANAATPVVWLTLRRPSVKLFRDRWRKGGLLVIDGFEQLTRCNQMLVVYETWVRKTGLLVTSHRPVRLPTLLTTEITLSQLKRIIELAVAKQPESRQPPRQECMFSDNHLQQLLARHHGNAREIMMSLYDEVNAK